MAIDTSGDMVGNILRSGGNSFRVNRMGTPPTRDAAHASAPEEVGESVTGQEAESARDVKPDVPRADQPSPSASRDLAKRRLSTSVTVDSTDVDWMKKERIRRRVEGDDGPYSFSGMLNEALIAALAVADDGGDIDDCSKSAHGDDLVRMAMSMNLETWLRVDEAIERYRADGVSAAQTRLSCFVRKGLDIMRGR